MSKKSPVHVEVRAYEGEAIEKTIKRFLRKCKKEGLQDQFMEKCCGAARYEKKSDIDRRRRRISLFKARRQNEEMNSEND